VEVLLRFQPVTVGLLVDIVGLTKVSLGVRRFSLSMPFHRLSPTYEANLENR
jgi:hypothetical protein